MKLTKEKLRAIIKEEVQNLREDEKNVPKDKELWNKVLAITRGDQEYFNYDGERIYGPNDGQGYDVYPSAYSNAWASKKYKELGGEWKTVDEVILKERTLPSFNIGDYEVVGLDRFDMGAPHKLTRKLRGRETHKRIDLQQISRDTNVERAFVKDRKSSGVVIETEGGVEHMVPNRLENAGIGDVVYVVLTKGGKQLEGVLIPKERIQEDLDQWFDEKWVDVSKTNDDGEHPPCGRDEDEENKGYPKCLPKKKADKLTKKEKERIVRRKRRKEKDDKSPEYVSSDPEDQRKKDENIYRKFYSDLLSSKS